MLGPFGRAGGPGRTADFRAGPFDFGTTFRVFSLVMTDKKELIGTDAGSGEDGETEQEASEPAAPAEPREPMPTIESRFMLVDIAALRAKQLRRGALPRVGDSSPASETGEASTRKLERIAVAEIDEGLIVYDIPDPESKAEDSDGAEAKKSS